MRKHPQNIFILRLRAAREGAGIPQDRPGVMIGIDKRCSSARTHRLFLLPIRGTQRVDSCDVRLECWGIGMAGEIGSTDTSKPKLE